MAAAVVDLNTVIKAVKEVELSTGRINDLAKGEDLVVVSATKEGTGDNTYISIKLKSGKKSIRGTVYSLAGLRICDEGADLSGIKSSVELRNSTLASTLQDYLAKDENAAVDLTKVTFKCKEVFPIVNNFSKTPGTPIYRNNCYAGFQVYTETTAEIRADENLSADVDKRNAAYNVASNALLATDVLPGMNIDANRVTVPVFTVTVS